MSVKIFGKGLGIFDHPFNTTTSTKVDVTDVITGFVQDTTLPGGKKRFDDHLVPTDTLQTTIQFPFKDIRKGHEEYPRERPTVDTGIRPQLMSADSGPAPFETLFHDFNIEAFPFYNFWTPDELTNDRDERGDRKFEDIPRFIKVTWNTAPDLIDPDERIRPKDVDKRAIRDVMFSREIERPKVFDSRGIGFSPEHLQPAGFSKIKSVLANGHLSPGVLETIVDMPLHNTGVESFRTFAQRDQENKLDEDAFLTNPEMAGVSIHELKAQIQQVTNGIANMGTFAREGVSSEIQGKKSALVDSKFIIKKSLKSGGSGQIAAIHPSSPTLGFDVNMAMSKKMPSSDIVMEMTSFITQPESVSKINSSAQVKVKFFNPAVGGLVQPSKVNLLATPHHAESMAAVALHLPSLEILSRTNLYEKNKQIDIPSLPSPKIKPLEYIGYILEKYRRQPSGVFTKVEEIDIPSRDADYYIDTKILYGETYRYRIKAILRWTRPIEQNLDGKNPTIVARKGSHTSPLSTHKSSYFSSEWGHAWAYGSCIDDQPPPPPDELTVRPESQKKQIVVTFRLPDNPQKDILKMRLLRKYQDENGRDISGWIQLSESGASDRKIDFAPGNVIYFDKDVDFFQKEKVKRVYAAQCVSRHGEDSVLSEQLCARLNEEYFTHGEFPVEFVSSPGVRFEYFGAFSTIPHRVTKTEVVVSPPPSRVGKSSGFASLVMSGRNTMGNVNLDTGKYVCRVQSLDTGEVKDIPFTVSMKNLPVRQEVSKFDFYAPSHAVSGKNSNDFDSESDARLRRELVSLTDGELLDTNGEENEVLVYDRSSKNDRW